MEKERYACKEHVEELLEMFLDEASEMPVLVALKGKQQPCEICGTRSVYELKGSDVKTTWE